MGYESDKGDEMNTNVFTVLFIGVILLNIYWGVMRVLCKINKINNNLYFSFSVISSFIKLIKAEKDHKKKLIYNIILWSFFVFTILLIVIFFVLF